MDPDTIGQTIAKLAYDKSIQLKVGGRDKRQPPHAVNEEMLFPPSFSP